MRDDAGQRHPVVLEDRFELEDVYGDVAAVDVVVLNPVHHRSAFFPRDLRRGRTRGPNLKDVRTLIVSAVLEKLLPLNVVAKLPMCEYPPRK